MGVSSSVPERSHQDESTDGPVLPKHRKHPACHQVFHLGYETCLLPSSSGANRRDQAGRLNCWKAAIPASARGLFDCANPLPFANLERRQRDPKRFFGKFNGQRWRQNAPSDRTGAGKKSSTRASSGRSFVEQRSSAYATQRVTAHDLSKGQIRIPSASASLTKTLFPWSKGAVAVAVNGRSLQGSWTPRVGPDRKRSGVLRIGSVIRDLVHEDEVLTASLRDGVICIDHL